MFAQATRTLWKIYRRLISELEPGGDMNTSLVLDLAEETGEDSFLLASFWAGGKTFYSTFGKKVTLADTIGWISAPPWTFVAFFV